MLITASVVALFHLIRVREGFFREGSLPQRLHNPCALVYAGQPGALPADRGFAWFVADEDGAMACARDLTKKIEQHRSLRRAWGYLR
jgi:hypothetical protein